MEEFKVTLGNEPHIKIAEYLNRGFAIAFESSDGDVSTCHHLYHDCKDKPIPEKRIKIIYIDFSNRKDLIAKWAEQNYKECSCNVKDHVKNSILPHIFCHVDVTDIIK